MKFSDIPGQKAIKDDLRAMADSHLMPHAIMLSGVSGIGKMCLARAFMQYAQCSSPRDGEPCGVCPSCRQHLSFNHPDMHFYYPIVKNKAQKIETSEDRIEEWKKMLTQHQWMPTEEWLDILDAGNSQPLIYVNDADNIVRADAYSSYTSRYKFFVIWLPEKLQPAAANKLLKVIEEPTEGTVFVLVSNNEADVLPTISSRTRRLNVLPPEAEEIERYIRNKYNLDENSARVIARLAQGRISKADELASHSGERGEFEELFKDIMRTAYAKNPGKLRAIGDNAAGMGREKLRRFFSYMTNMVRENFIYNLRMPALSSMTEGEETFSKRFSPFIHHGNVEDLVNSIAEASEHVERNGNSKLILFSLFLQIIPLLHRNPST
ncbi:MAG: DNA polymerase III subunit delta [Muribaculaceae bacterium]|nr:DNA polymerase III subunit delta [Muribaculaceae bacterium]